MTHHQGKHPAAGDGSTKHLDEAVDLPGDIELQDGVYEVGREEPADVVIPVPTVSGRHALLRISKPLNSAILQVRGRLYSLCDRLQTARLHLW